MSAAICVLGVAWLGTTFVKAHETTIKEYAGSILTDHPWTLAIVLFVAASLLYSQAATTKALIPTALAIGVSPSRRWPPSPPCRRCSSSRPTRRSSPRSRSTTPAPPRSGTTSSTTRSFMPGLIAIVLSVAFAFGLGAIII